MQIHEITKHDSEQLDEVVGGLARMAGQAVARSGLGQAVGQAASDIKQGFQQSAVGRTLQKAADVQQQAKLAGNTQAIAKAALQQWNNKVLQLTQAAGGQPVDPADYTNYLTDFVQKVLLNGTRVQDLDNSSQPKVAAAIKGVVDNRADSRKLPQAFNALVTQAGAARPDPAKVRGGGGAATAGGFVTTPIANLQIRPATQQNPQTLVKFKNDIYRLDDKNQWLDARDRPVPETMAALLNMAALSI